MANTTKTTTVNTTAIQTTNTNKGTDMTNLKEVTVNTPTKNDADKVTVYNIDQTILDNFNNTLLDISTNIDSIEELAINLVSELVDANQDTLKYINSQVMPAYIAKYTQTTLFKSVKDIIVLMIKGAKLPSDAAGRTIGNVLKIVKEDFKTFQIKEAKKEAKKAQKAAKDVEKSDASEEVKLTVKAEAKKAELDLLKSELANADEKAKEILEPKVKQKEKEMLDTQKEILLVKEQDAKALNNTKELENIKKEKAIIAKKEDAIKEQDNKKEDLAKDIATSLKELKKLKLMSNDDLMESLINATDNELNALKSSIEIVTNFLTQKEEEKESIAA
jgi:hypothetical protein